MPSRKRSREAAKARKRAELEAEGIDADKRTKVRRRGKRRAGGRGRGGHRNRDLGRQAGPKRPLTGPMLDPSADEGAEVRFVMAGDALKSYICPGCNRDIPPAVGHIVAVPPNAPDLRRHWHRGCWEHRHTRF